MLNRCLLLVLLAALVAGCSSPGKPATPAAPLAGLPPLPGDAGRKPAIASLYRAGASFDQQYGGTVVDGTKLKLAWTPPSPVSYAIYRFAATPDDVLTDLTYFASDKATLLSPIWIAVADFSTGT